MEEEHPFYGKIILKGREQEKVEKLLKKFSNFPITDELHKRIWDELQEAKRRGEITIPFKVAMRRGVPGKYPDSIEVILDTKL